MADITMPQLGETVTEGTITKWRKKVGDAVAEDEVLFEVSTDKVDSEVPSPVSGTLTQIVANEGDTVPVGTVIAVVEAGGAAAAAPAAPVAQAAPEAPVAAPVAPPAAPPSTFAPPPAPVAPPVAAAPPPPPAPVAPAPVMAPTPVTPVNGASFDGGGKVLSPVVRKLLAEHNLNAAQITGTGAGGRITRRDVETLIGSGALTSVATQPVSSAAPVAPAAPVVSAPAPVASATNPVVDRATPIPPPIAASGDSVIPMSNIRKRTAEHMIRSKATSAHTLVVIEVDFNNVDSVRLPAKDAFKSQEGVNLTYLPFIARAVVDALREFPFLNASVGTDELILHSAINLGFAVDMNFEGLIVPVVKQAESKRLRVLTREVADLAERARNKRLSTDEIQGGTFTITNAGGYGTFVTYPVINQPQIGILSTDGVKKRPVVVEGADGSDTIAIHPVGNLALAWDHRAVDGAYAAAFIARVKQILETRNWAEEL